MEQETELPPGAEYVAEADDKYPFKMVDVARFCGIHRVTVLRLEQRNIIPKARWRRLPQPHRVYSQADLDAIKQTLHDRAPKNRVYVEDETTVVVS